MTKGVVTRREPDATDRKAWPLITSHGGYTPGEVRRFLAKVARGAPDECWRWTSGLTAMRPHSPGYGYLTRDGSIGGQVYAHRMSYALAFGPLPRGYEAAHRCNNGPCVNPAHLYAATRRQNTIDAYRDGLMAPPRGEASHLSKLTEADVAYARRTAASGVAIGDIAAELHVTYGTIRSVVMGRTWSHVGGARTSVKVYGCSARNDAETLAFIRAHWDTFGRSPTLRQIAAALGLADASGALSRVRRLEARGLVTRDQLSGPGGARPIRLVVAA